jgi:hypothetical protein
MAEPLSPLPPIIAPLRRVRSTLIVASIATLREQGYFDAYQRLLVGDHRATILEAVAGTWLPVDAATVHYEACDGLGLSEKQQITIGRSVAKGLRGTVTGALLVLSRQGGVTPWTLLGTIERFWNRLFEGSALHASKLGPKEARLDAYEMPLLQSRYFRAAFRGQAMVALDLFCTKSYVVDLALNPKDAHFAFRAQWA